ncbi:MAG: hypothetical protein ACJA13_000058 [Paraglaciecola sp.]|jgi:hypothetical protein
MSNNQQYIVSLCQQLVKDGKKPTVALVRNRAQRSLAIPDVIKGLQNWQHSPQQSVQLPDDMPGEIKEPSTSLEKRVVLLEQQVLQLSAALAALTSHKK